MSGASNPVNGPFIFRGRLNATDIGQIAWYRYQVLYRRPLRVATLFVLLAVIPVAIWWDEGYAIAAVGGWFWALFLTPRVVVGYAQTQYRKNTAGYLESTVVISDAGAVIENAIASSSFRWAAVGLVADTPRGLLFLATNAAFLFWLPPRAFEGDEHRERVRDALVRWGVHVRNVA